MFAVGGGRRSPSEGIAGWHLLSPLGHYSELWAAKALRKDCGEEMSWVCSLRKSYMEAKFIHSFYFVPLLYIFIKSLIFYLWKSVG